MPAPKKPRARPHDEPTIQLALTLLAVNGGRTRITSEQLAEKGISVHVATLADWRDRLHPHRYHEIREAKGKEIAAEMARQAEEFVAEAADVQLKALRKLDGEIDSGELSGKDLSMALRNLADARSKDMDKIANPLMGRASQVVQHLAPSPQEVFSKLRELGVEIVESTAEEIPQAELVPHSP